MGKRGKHQKQKKNRKVRKNYNKKEFSEVFCQTCLICKNSNADFCYANLYKHEPNPFIKKVFNNLIDIHATYQAMGKSLRSMSIEQFQNVVCRTGICFDGDVFAAAQCDNVTPCYKDFMSQMGVGNAAVIHEWKATDLIEFKNNKTNKSFISYRKKKKKRNKRYVCTPYATFFSKNDDDFQAAIRRILYGDNDIEQDKDKELSASDSGAADRDTKGGESKAHRSSSEGSMDGES
jgi:hypothetical protein